MRSWAHCRSASSRKRSGRRRPSANTHTRPMTKQIRSYADVRQAKQANADAQIDEVIRRAVGDTGEGRGRTVVEIARFRSRRF
jgi:hypothetical protein